MHTPMNAGILVEDRNLGHLTAALPMGRLWAAEDIAGLAAFLASDDSSYCTGGICTCDGGLTAV
jgi:NAD(P)-dependent dehydrogenase (short-subunit alcohol dehydrogenase family)